MLKVVHTLYCFTGKLWRKTSSSTWRVLRNRTQLTLNCLHLWDIVFISLKGCVALTVDLSAVVHVNCRCMSSRLFLMKTAYYSVSLSNCSVGKATKRLYTFLRYRCSFSGSQVTVKDSWSFVFRLDISHRTCYQ